MDEKEIIITDEAEEDEDVVMEGSVLHEHLVSCELGFDFEVVNNVVAQNESKDEDHQITVQDCKKQKFNDIEEGKVKLIVSRMILESKLLVAEDEEFIQNFIASPNNFDLLSTQIGNGNKSERSSIGFAALVPATITAASLTYFWNPKSFKVFSISAAAGLLGIGISWTIRNFLYKTEINSFKKLSQSLESLEQLKSILDKVGG